MKKAAILAILSLITYITDAQKPTIDPSSNSTWIQAKYPSLSNDGRYALYTVDNQPLAHQKTIVVKSLKTEWEVKLIDIKSFQFSTDSKLFVFQTLKDSLGMIPLGDTAIEYIPNVSSFRLSREGTSDWLIYQLNNDNKELHVKNTETNWQKKFSKVLSYQLLDTKNDCKLLLEFQQPDKESALKYEKLSTDSMVSIWEGPSPRSIIYDRTGNQIAFLSKNATADAPSDELWYYKIGMNAAEKLLTNYPSNSDSNLRISTLVGFNAIGTNIYFNIAPKSLPSPLPAKSVNVEIWGYEDEILQSLQKANLSRNLSRSFLCIANIETRHAIRLEKENERVVNLDNIAFKGYNDEHLILLKAGDGVYSNEYNWNKSALTTLLLLSTKDGTRVPLKSDIPLPYAQTYRLSPTGRYVLFFNPALISWCTYKVSSQTVNNITKGIPAIWAVKDLVASLFPFDDPEWLENDSALVAFDQYDIFSLDPKGVRAPICLTNYYGRKHKIRLRPIDKAHFTENFGRLSILSAFNTSTMDDGFFECSFQKNDTPTRIIMQPYMYTGVPESDRFSVITPIKARDADVYIVRRMRAEESPNYFITTDFKTYSPLTSTYPERSYNWLTSELVKWSTLDGSPSTGILYKPENFDPHKQYPIIFYYYQQLSAGLHGFLEPENFGATLDIPFFVSNGYLVFVPDIHYTIGHPGKSAYNSIVSAALYLSKRKYVDEKHMGIQGHSFGGYETNYVVTHSLLFAAACAAAGMSDLVMNYNSITDLPRGTSLEGTFEIARWRIGATLWERPDLYMENSPILKADKVSTPILLINNQKDDNIPFLNGIEFFTALRRLQKKAWLLNYSDEGHIIHNGRSALDYKIRMKQFFDHFLKNAPAPRWMMEGIPARLQGIDLGYDVAPPGKSIEKNLITATGNWDANHRD